MKKIMNMVGLLIAGVVIGYLLLILVYLLPVDTMQQNAKRSLQVYETETDYQRVIPGYISTQLDNYTDSWMLGNAVFKSDASIWKRALTCTRAEYENGPRESLIQYLNGDEGYTQEDYCRYWHGYLIVLKPLLLLFSYADIRVVNFGIEFLLGIIVYGELKKRGYQKQSILYFISLLFIMPIVIPLSMQFSVIYYIMQISMIIILKKYEWFAQKKNLYLYFELLGMVTSYFDFLTYPIAGLGMSLICLLLLEYQVGMWEKIRKIVGYSFMWGLGYISMWAGKWILATCILKEDIILDAISQAAMRTTKEQGTDKMGLLDVWIRNTEFYFERPYVILIVLCIVITIAFFIIRRVPVERLFIQGIPLMLVGIMPFVWYGLVRQHSYEHHWFTFRGLIVTVFACFCTVAQTCSKEK